MGTEHRRERRPGYMTAGGQMANAYQNAGNARASSYEGMANAVNAGVGNYAFSHYMNKIKPTGT